MLPTLYKQNSRGKNQLWKISVENNPVGYRTEYGQEGGKIQNTFVEVKSGKNIGKSNETTPLEQAELEAKALWTKQLDKGYVENITQVRKKGSLLLPMLAQSYDKHAKKIKFPCYGQPKLDGVRCLFDGKLISRKGKEFTSCPHIIKQLEKLRLDIDGLILDGELYNDSDDFEDLISYIRREDASSETEAIEYHIYDCFYLGEEEQKYSDRLAIIEKLSKRFGSHIKLVNTVEIKSDKEVDKFHDDMVDVGYEGVMLRNIDGIYERDKRSYDLQKVKSFLDGEFEIVGYERNKGRQSNQCTILCKTAEGKEFGAKPKGNEKKREWYLENITDLMGQKATVRYFEMSKDNVPRFPILIGVRNYE